MALCRGSSKNVEVVFTGVVVISTFLQELLPLGAAALLHVHTNECSQQLAFGAELQMQVEKRKEKTTSFGINSMRSQVVYRAAQQMQVDMVTAQLEIRSLGIKSYDMCVVYRARDAAAREKAAAAESKEKEEELQASTSRLQKQIDKAVAERNSAEGRSQRSAASLLKVKADLAALEIKMQVMHLTLLLNVSTSSTA